MPSLLYKCMTKATTAQGDQMRYGPNWILSRRAILKVYDDHLECGDWSIDYTTIREAVLLSIRSSFFVPGYVLRIQTSDKVFHFGLNWGRFWKGELPFAARRERGKMAYSWFSIIVRAGLIGYILYLIWARFNR